MTILSKFFSHQVAIPPLGTKVCSFLPCSQFRERKLESLNRAVCQNHLWSFKKAVSRPRPDWMNQNLGAWGLTMRMTLNVLRWLWGRTSIENQCPHSLIIRAFLHHLTNKLAGTQALLLRKGSRAPGPLEDKKHVRATGCLAHDKKGTWTIGGTCGNLGLLKFHQESKAVAEPTPFFSSATNFIWSWPWETAGFGFSSFPLALHSGTYPRMEEGANWVTPGTGPFLPSEAEHFILILGTSDVFHGGHGCCFSIIKPNKTLMQVYLKIRKPKIKNPWYTHMKIHTSACKKVMPPLFCLLTIHL